MNKYRLEKFIEKSKEYCKNHEKDTYCPKCVFGTDFHCCLGDLIKLIRKELENE